MQFYVQLQKSFWTEMSKSPSFQPIEQRMAKLLRRSMGPPNMATPVFIILHRVYLLVIKNLLCDSCLLRKFEIPILSFMWMQSNDKEFCGLLIADTHIIYFAVMKNSLVLYDNVCALMGLLWSHLNVLTSSQYYSYLRQRNRLAYTGSSVDI